MDISGLGTHAFPSAYTCGFQGDLHVLVKHMVTTFFGTADCFGKKRRRDSTALVYEKGLSGIEFLACRLWPPF